MNWPEVVLLIVLISGVVKIVRARHGVVERHSDDYGRAPHDSAEAERLRGEVRQLRDRIQVLERIVTDGDHSRSIALDREIEALRADRSGELR